MQINGSRIKGNAIRIKTRELLTSFVFKIIHTNTPPKKLLPTSPINIFDGCQFQNRNPKSAPIRPKIEPEIKVIDENRKTNIKPVNKPSKPSIKLQKFINAVEIKTNKIISNTFTIKFKFESSEEYKFELKTIYVEVNTCIRNLIHLLISLISSIKLKILKGKRKTKLDCLNNELLIMLVKINANPPPLGFISL